MNGVRWGLGLKRVYSLFPLQCISGLESTLTALHNEGRRGCLLHSSPKAFIHCQVSGHHVSQHEYPDHSTVVFAGLFILFIFLARCQSRCTELLRHSCYFTWVHSLLRACHQSYTQHEASPNLNTKERK